jgi:hypothetical protein
VTKLVMTICNFEISPNLRVNYSASPGMSSKITSAQIHQVFFDHQSFSYMFLRSTDSARRPGVNKVWWEYLWGEIWRRGWDSNPRMEVLQTSPLGHLGTAPKL